MSLNTETSIFNYLISKLDELRLPSKSWGAHICGEKLALLSVKSTSYDSSVELFKSVVLYENEEQHLQVNTTIQQISVKVPYLNYDIRDIIHLQAFVNDFEKVQFCKYFIIIKDGACETVGKDFSDICSNCETAHIGVEINPQCNKESSSSDTFECRKCPEKFSSLEAMKCHSYVFHDNQLIYTVPSKELEKQPPNEQPDYMCKICGSRWDSSKELLDHEVTHFSGSSRCIVCQERFNCVQRLVTHTKKYHPNVPFINCHLCSKKFVAARYLRVHLR